MTVFFSSFLNGLTICCRVACIVRPSVNICANRFFSQANGWIAIKHAHDGSQPGLHQQCAVLKVNVEVKGRVIWALLWFHKNQFFSQTKGLDYHRTCTDWSPHWSASKMFSSSRTKSKLTWYEHFCDFKKNKIASSPRQMAGSWTVTPLLTSPSLFFCTLSPNGCEFALWVLP